MYLRGQPWEQKGNGGGGVGFGEEALGLRLSGDGFAVELQHLVAATDASVPGRHAALGHATHEALELVLLTCAAVAHADTHPLAFRLVQRHHL